MLVGDLCLSLIPASPGDSGLFLREAYLNGSYPTWRLPLLLGTGLMGMALGVFTVRVSIQQILPQYRKTRRAAGIGGAVYPVSYTHLDVYKRQALHRIFPHAGIHNIRRCRTNAVQNKSPFPEPSSEYQ